MPNLPSPAQSDLRVALVHDFLLDMRGAERVFAELCEMWPQADIFTAVYDEDATEGVFAGRNVQTSFLQRVRPSTRTFRALLPLYPAAIESFDMSGYDLVVSSSSAWAHAVLCDEQTTHVSYCHNPFRYAWNDRDRTLSRLRDPLTRTFLRTTFRRWRQWDWIAAQRTNRYIANSQITRARVRAYFGREASVVHPPVRTERFSPGTVGDYYLVVSELMGHKRIDLAIAAFNKLKLPLVVVGDGPDRRRLRRGAASTIHFAGRLTDTEVAAAARGARALVLTSIEEFGIAAVEAQAAGRPVIARRGGGALETVIDGVTGCFWQDGPDDLAAAVVRFDDASVDPMACVRNAQRFDTRNFRRGMLRQVEEARMTAAGSPAHRHQLRTSNQRIRRSVTDPHR